MKTPDKTNSISFEEAMNELESIVNTLEQGELPLEEALIAFERATKLSRLSHQKLQEAEQKVQVLMQKEGHNTLADYNAEESTPIDHDDLF